MRIFALLALLLAPSGLYAAEDMRVDFDEAQVNLSTKPESSWNFLDVVMYLSGEGLKDAQWFYSPVFTRVETENTDLLENDDNGTSDERIWRMELIKKNEGRYRLWERFKPPGRHDRHLYVEGYVEVFKNAGSGNMVEIDDYLEHSGKPVNAPLFKKHGIEFMFLTKDDLLELKEEKQQHGMNPEAIGEELGQMLSQAFQGLFGFGDKPGLAFVMRGNSNAILNIVLLNKSGEAIEAGSRSISRDKEGIVSYKVDYTKMLPHKGKIRVYVDNGKGMRKVPFKFKVALP